MQQSKEISGSFTYWPGNLIFGDMEINDSLVYCMELRCLASSEDCGVYDNLIWQSPLSIERDFTFLLPKCKWNNSSFEIRLLLESSGAIQHSETFATGSSEIFFLPLIVPNQYLYARDIRTSYEKAVIYSNTKNAYFGISRNEMIYICLITFTLAILNVLFSRPIDYKQKRKSTKKNKNTHTHDFIDYLLEDGSANMSVVEYGKNSKKNESDIFYSSGPSSFHFVRRTTNNYVITH